MKPFAALSGLIVGFLLLSGNEAQDAAPRAPQRSVDFVRDIQPIFKESCTIHFRKVALRKLE